MPSLLHRQAEACGHRWAGGALRAALRPAGQEVAAKPLPKAGADQRQAVLRQLKLKALVESHFGAVASDVAPGLFPGGASLSVPRSGAAWVLVDDGSRRALGPALAWAHRERADQVHLLVEGAEAAAVLARRAGLFARPPMIWLVRGRSLEPATPAPVPPMAPPPPDADAFADVLRDHGIEPVLEHGILIGEVRGLEVARVVVDGAGAGPRLEVGVGHHDRFARQELDRARWGGRLADIGAALDEVVAVVRKWRVPDAPAHPANRLARSRWLRAALRAHPQLVGASALEPVPPPIRREGLLESMPAAAVGPEREGGSRVAGGEGGSRVAGREGGSLVAVCSTGIDLDLVPDAADSTLLAGATGHDDVRRLVLVVPAADNHPVTRDLAGALRMAAEVVVAPSDWESLAG